MHICINNTFSTTTTTTTNIYRYNRCGVLFAYDDPTCICQVRSGKPSWKSFFPWKWALGPLGQVAKKSGRDFSAGRCSGAEKNGHQETHADWQEAVYGRDNRRICWSQSSVKRVLCVFFLGIEFRISWKPQHFESSWYFRISQLWDFVVKQIAGGPNSSIAAGQPLCAWGLHRDYFGCRDTRVGVIGMAPSTPLATKKLRMNLDGCEMLKKNRFDPKNIQVHPKYLGFGSIKHLFFNT